MFANILLHNHGDNLPGTGMLAFARAFAPLNIIPLLTTEYEISCALENETIMSAPCANRSQCSLLLYAYFTANNLLKNVS